MNYIVNASFLVGELYQDSRLVLFYGIFIGNIGPSKHFRAQPSDSISVKRTVTLHSDLHLNSIRAETTITGLGFQEGLTSIASH